MAAAMELQFAAKQDVEDRTRDDPVELLTGALYICGTGEDDRKIVSSEEASQAHIRRSARNCIRGRGIEWRILGNNSTGAAIDLRSGEVDITLQEIEMAQPVMQLDGGDNIGLKPVLGMFPALTNHTLGRKIDDVSRFLFFDQRGQRVEILV